MCVSPCELLALAVRYSTVSRTVPGVRVFELVNTATVPKLFTSGFSPASCARVLTAVRAGCATVGGVRRHVSAAAGYRMPRDVLTLLSQESDACLASPWER